MANIDLTLKQNDGIVSNHLSMVSSQVKRISDMLYIPYNVSSRSVYIGRLPPTVFPDLSYALNKTGRVTGVDHFNIVQKALASFPDDYQFNAVQPFEYSVIVTNANMQYLIDISTSLFRYPAWVTSVFGMILFPTYMFHDMNKLNPSKFQGFLNMISSIMKYDIFNRDQKKVQDVTLVTHLIDFKFDNSYLTLPNDPFVGVSIASSPTDRKIEFLTTPFLYSSQYAESIFMPSDTMIPVCFLNPSDVTDNFFDYLILSYQKKAPIYHFEARIVTACVNATYYNTFHNTKSMMDGVDSDTSIMIYKGLLFSTRTVDWDTASPGHQDVISDLDNKAKKYSDEYTMWLDYLEQLPDNDSLDWDAYTGLLNDLAKKETDKKQAILVKEMEEHTAKMTATELEKLDRQKKIDASNKQLIVQQLKDQDDKIKQLLNEERDKEKQLDLKDIDLDIPVSLHLRRDALIKDFEAKLLDPNLTTAQLAHERSVHDALIETVNDQIRLSEMSLNQIEAERQKQQNLLTNGRIGVVNKSKKKATVVNSMKVTKQSLDGLPLLDYMNGSQVCGVKSKRLTSRRKRNGQPLSPLPAPPSPGSSSSESSDESSVTSLESSTSDNVNASIDGSDLEKIILRNTKKSEVAVTIRDLIMSFNPYYLSATTTRRMPINGATSYVVPNNDSYHLSNANLSTIMNYETTISLRRVIKSGNMLQKVELTEPVEYVNSVMPDRVFKTYGEAMDYYATDVTRKAGSTSVLYRSFQFASTMKNIALNYSKTADQSVINAMDSLNSYLYEFAGTFNFSDSIDFDFQRDIVQIPASQLNLWRILSSFPKGAFEVGYLSNTRAKSMLFPSIPSDVCRYLLALFISTDIQYRAAKNAPHPLIDYKINLYHIAILFLNVNSIVLSGNNVDDKLEFSGMAKLRPTMVTLPIELLFIIMCNLANVGDFFDKDDDVDYIPIEDDLIDMSSDNYPNSDISQA